jgi:hypothetical protein
MAANIGLLSRDCVTLCQGISSIFPLNFEGSSNSFDGRFISEFIPCKGLQIEDLVRTKVRIHKIIVESSVAGVSFTATFSDDSGKENVKRDGKSWGIGSSHVG